MYKEHRINFNCKKDRCVFLMVCTHQLFIWGFCFYCFLFFFWFLSFHKCYTNVCLNLGARSPSHRSLFYRLNSKYMYFFWMSRACVNGFGNVHMFFFQPLFGAPFSNRLSSCESLSSSALPRLWLHTVHMQSKVDQLSTI